MYHPLVLALEAWLGEADASARASVVEAAPGAALIVPSLGASPGDGSPLMMVVDALLSRVVGQGPTVLVVDDMQWADPATRDALAYLVAGFRRQRMALVTSHRDGARDGRGLRSPATVGRGPMDSWPPARPRTRRDASGNPTRVTPYSATSVSWL